MIGKINVIVLDHLAQTMSRVLWGKSSISTIELEKIEAIG